MSYDEERSWVEWIVGPLLDPGVDVVLGLAVALLSSAAIVLIDGPLRIAFALPLVLFLPGYALVSALFPRGEGWTPSRQVRTTTANGITVGERVALGFGTSVALLPPLGVVLLGFGVPLDAYHAVESLGGISVAGLLVAAVRRWRLPERERFRVPYDRWYRELHGAVVGQDSSVDAALNVAVILAVLLATSTLAYAVVTSPGGDSYTGFAVLTENDSGDLVAAGYPREFVEGSSERVVLSIANREGEPVTYTVVVALQDVDESGTPTARSELARFSGTVRNGETWRRPVNVTPSRTGEDMRLVFYLYEGPAPPDPSTETASEYVHIWIDIRAPSGAQVSPPG